VTLAAPPRRLPVRRRGLALAGALGLLSLGLPWQQIPSMPGVVLPGVVIGYPDGTGLGVAWVPAVFVPSIPGGVVPGTGHAMRVTGVVAALLLVRAIRQHSHRTAWLALAAGALALPLGVGQGALMPGRIAYLAALLVAAASLGLLRTPRLGRANPSAGPPS
jgi:hypothetical protein